MGEPFAPRPWLEAALAAALVDSNSGATPPRVRVIRSEPGWAIVEVEHAWLPEARRAWNGPITGPAGRRASVTTHRTWGTLKEAKAWLRRRPIPAARAGPSPVEPVP